MPGRPFVKGESGNPGGRPAALREFRDKAQKLSDIALATLVKALTSEDGRTRVIAAKEILDRAWGKATQTIAGPDGGPVAIDTSNALLEALRAMAQRKP
jgi:hypothetical protein